MISLIGDNIINNTIDMGTSRWIVKFGLLTRLGWRDMCKYFCGKNLSLKVSTGQALWLFRDYWMFHNKMDISQLCCEMFVLYRTFHNRNIMKNFNFRPLLTWIVSEVIRTYISVGFLCQKYLSCSQPRRVKIFFSLYNSVSDMPMP